MSQETRNQQPYLHDMISCVRAPSVVLCGADGQVRNRGVQGWLRDDLRLLSRLEVQLDGIDPEPVGHALLGADSARFMAVARHLGDPGADPTVRVERQRQVSAIGVHEQFDLTNNARTEVNTTLTVRIGADLAPLAILRHGSAGVAVPMEAGTDALTWGENALVRSYTEPVPDQVAADAEGALLTWRVRIPSHGRWHCSLRFTARDSGLFSAPTENAPTWTARLRSSSGVLDRVFGQSLNDLAALRLSDPGHPDDTFLAAGSPWYYTLFGRDSLWAARMLLPLDVDLAAGTLRVLARRQGHRHDADTAERPGRVPHEVRKESASEHGHGLPPVYYGTIDATPLWVVLLSEAWHWGMPEDDLRALLPNLLAALDWITGSADEDGDGFLDYLDVRGVGLANQGWKDSGDSIQWPDGRIADPPISLCEAQAYAYQAVLAGADLLDTLGAADPEPYRAWARHLRLRFRESFWVEDTHGAFPAIALDGAKHPVPTATSNLGHLLGTGLLDPAESSLVARRLTGEDLNCGYGLRTMSAHATGFNPLGYHAGSVWPHDTAIAVWGLSRDGAGDVAASLADGLVTAAFAFDHRLPELYSGTTASSGEPVVAYPAACRPQAWSAGAVLFLLRAALRLEADIPAGVLRVDPDPAFEHWFPLRIENLRLVGHPLHVQVDASGTAMIETNAPVRLHGDGVEKRLPR